MLTNTNHRVTDQRTGDSSDPTEHPTPPHDRRPYWNEDIASFSAAVVAAYRNRRLPCGYQQSTRLVQ